MQRVIERAQPGWKVWGSDDREIGQVSEPGEGYLRMTKGLIFGKTLFVPEQYVERAEEETERVYLRIPKDTIDSMGWDKEPGIAEDDVINLGPGGKGPEEGPNTYRMPR